MGIYIFINIVMEILKSVKLWKEKILLMIGSIFTLLIIDQLDKLMLLLNILKVKDN